MEAERPHPCGGLFGCQIMQFDPSIIVLPIISIACIIGAIFMYRNKEETQGIASGNGSGMGLYGRSDYDPIDKSYITTKWFMIMLIPIFPIRSYRVIKMTADDALLPGGITLYRKKVIYKMQKVSLHWRQIIITYLITALILKAFLYFFSYLFRTPLG